MWLTDLLLLSSSLASLALAAPAESPAKRDTDSVSAGTSSANSTAESTIVVTATTGTPPPVVTYVASQDTALKTLSAVTTSNGTKVFPLGWFWTPVSPIGAPPLPPVIPPPPPEATPPQVKASTSKEPATSSLSSGCTSQQTPTVTVTISYPTNIDGDYLTSRVTHQSSVGKTSCVVPETTETTTAKFKKPTVFMDGSTIDGGPSPTGPVPTVDKGVQQYLDSVFDSLGIGSADYASTTTQAIAKCADNTYQKAIPNAAAFIHGLSPHFCSEWSAKPTKALTTKLTAKDAGKGSKNDAKVKKRSPPPAPLTSDSYPGWSINFGWTPADLSASCKKLDYCDTALASLLNHCEGFSTSDAYKGGVIQDACGAFSYTLSGYPSLTTATPTAAPTPSGLTCDLASINDPASDNAAKIYPQSAYEAAAHQFCYGGYNWNADPANSTTSSDYFWFDSTHIDPSTNLPAYCEGANYGTYEQWSPSSSKYCQHSGSGTGLMNSDSKIWVQVIPSPEQDGCFKLEDYSLPEGSNCYKNFMNVITTCMPADGGGKSGVWKELTPNGCWDWWLWGRTLT